MQQAEYCKSAVVVHAIIQGVYETRGVTIFHQHGQLGYVATYLVVSTASAHAAADSSTVKVPVRSLDRKKRATQQ